MNNYNTYTRFIDPGHSWLRVPKTHVPNHIIDQFSECSYESKRYYYLEEDRDIDIFRKNMPDFNTKLKYSKTSSKIRSLKGLEK